MKNYKAILFRDIGLSLKDITIDEIRINKHAPEVDGSEHKHEDFEQLLIFINGKAKISIDGSTFNANSGSIFLIKRNQLHCIEKLSWKSNFLAVVINLRLDTSTMHEISKAHFNYTNIKKIKKLLNKIFNLSQLASDTKRKNIALSSIILGILDLALSELRWLKLYNRFSTTRHFSTTNIVKRTIEKNHSLSLEEIAEMVEMEYNSLNNIVKEESGFTIGQLRNSYRVEQAKKFLSKSSKIKQVASQMGFSDANYFSRWFKLHSGKKPSTWLKKSL